MMLLSDHRNKPNPELTQMTNQTTLTAIDEYGFLKAQMADLLAQEKILKARLGDLVPGAYESDLYRLAISEPVYETRDEAFKARIEELIAEHVSSQYQVAHTIKSPRRTLKVSARTGRRVAA